MSDPRDTPGMTPPAPAPRLAAPPPEAPEDARTQALSDALRHSFVVIKLIMGALLLVFLGSGFFVVQQQNKAIVLRFGQPVGGARGELLGPGFHWAFPYPIDEKVFIPVGQVLSVNSTVGWYATLAGQEPSTPPGDALNPATEGYLLTADHNIIHARGTLRYRIAEPGLRYSFDFRNASNMVQNAFDSALVYAAAHYTVDDALTRDVAGFRETVRRRLEQLVEERGLGIAVEQLDNMQVTPPRKLAAAFFAVTEARERGGQAITDARKYEAETTNSAASQAAARTNQAENARNRLVKMVAAEAERFTNNLPEYHRNPDFFRHRYQAEAMERILTNAREKMIIPDRADGQRRELRLQLSRELEKPRTVKEEEHGH